MNYQMILVVVTFLAAATLVLGANAPNANAPPALLTAAAPPNLQAPNPANPGQPGALTEPSQGNSDDLNADSTWGLFGGWGGGWGYPYYRGYYGYPYYRRYYGGYGYGGYPYYGGYGYGW